MAYADLDKKRKHDRIANAKWREENREHHRAYMRSWMKKRRENPEKKKADDEKRKESGSYEKAKIKSLPRQREYVQNLADCYIISLLSRRGDITRDLAKEYPEIIEHHKIIIQTKRKLKNLCLPK